MNFHWAEICTFLSTSMTDIIGWGNKIGIKFVLRSFLGLLSVDSSTKKSRMLIFRMKNFGEKCGQIFKIFEERCSSSNRLHNKQNISITSKNVEERKSCPKGLFPSFNVFSTKNLMSDQGEYEVAYLSFVFAGLEDISYWSLPSGPSKEEIGVFEGTRATMTDVFFGIRQKSSVYAEGSHVLRNIQNNKKHRTFSSLGIRQFQIKIS
jgi:hypothetical protein